MATVADIRLREDAPDVRWVLFFDGIPYAFTNDNGQGRGTLLGSGASSWIGLSETAIGGVEVAGARTVLDGLQMPRTFREAVDVKSGEPKPSPITFTLHDDEAGTLAGLFGREHKEFDILGQRIGAGTSNLLATALGQGGDAIPIWGRNIGVERIGAAGQRRLFPPIPETLVGLEHSVYQEAVGPERLPPIYVSDEPIQWTGRLFALYMIYRDPDSTATDASAWPTWDLQATLGRQLVGKVIRGPRQRGRVWEIECHGRDGLLRKQLGRVTTAKWQPVSTELSSVAVEQGVAIDFQRQSPLEFPGTFDGLTFGGATLTSTSKVDLVAELHDLIQDVYDGTTTNTVGTEGQLDAWSEAGVPQNAEVGAQMGTPASLYCRKRDVSADHYWLAMTVAMHATRWRQLGFEPETQDFDNSGDATSDDRQIRFVPLQGGTEYGTGPEQVFPTGADVPGEGYWAARVTTVALGANEQLPNIDAWDNNGNRRHWYAKYPGEPFMLDMQASDQLVRLGGAISPYVEGQLTVEVSGNDVDGAAGEFARFWALRGKVQTEPDQEPIDTVQVAQLEWVDGVYGNIDPGTGANPAAIIRQWMDPRLFGFPFERLDGLDYWTGVAGGDGQIDAVPLSAYAYMGTDVPEYAHHVWGQVLLSTGSGGGVAGGVITEGGNTPGYGGSLRWGSDVEIADMGCSIPYQLVADLEDVLAVFEELPGGADGDLQRVRYAYIGPFLAQDILGSIMRPRALMWSYHGDVIGVRRLAPFSPLLADVSIGEVDLYGTRDPRSLMPSQEPTPMGQIDGVDLEFRWRPDEGSTTGALQVLSRDSEASARTGELIEKVVDHGLLDATTFAELGLGSWHDEFETLWAVQQAEFFARDHYMIRLRVSRPKGQDMRPGTRVLLTNPWPSNNAGGYGLTDHVGIVTSREVDTSTHAVLVSVFVFAGQGFGWRFFAPMARVLDQVGAVLTLSADEFGHGDANIADGDGLERPSYSSAGEGRLVRILYRIGEDFQLGEALTVSTWNAATNELTLTTTPDTTIEYADRWVLMEPYDAQAAQTYPRSVFGVVVKDDLTHGVGPTVGRPFEE